MDSKREKLRILCCLGGNWELVNGVLVYMPLDLKKRVLYVSHGIKFSKLVKEVAKRFKIEGEFRLSYQSPPSIDVIDIVDDYDVFGFFQIATEGAVILYVVQCVDLPVPRSGTGSNQMASVAPATVFPESQQQIQTRPVGVQSSHRPLSFDLNVACNEFPEMQQYEDGGAYNPVYEHHGPSVVYPNTYQQFPECQSSDFTGFAPPLNKSFREETSYAVGTSEQAADVRNQDDNVLESENEKVIVDDDNLVISGDKSCHGFDDPETSLFMGLSDIDEDEEEGEEEEEEEADGDKQGKVEEVDPCVADSFWGMPPPYLHQPQL